MNRCILDGEESLRLRLHPEALFCEPYRTHELDAGTYAPARGPWRGHTEGSAVCFGSADGAALCVSAAGEGILRVRASRGPTVPESITEKLGLLSVPDAVPLELRGCRCTHGQMTFALDAQTGDWRVRRDDGTTLCATLGGGFRWTDQPPAFGGERFLAAFDMPAGPIYGFGGRIAPFNRRGSTADMYAVKAGELAGDYGGFPIPVWLSPEGFAVFLNNPWPHVYFDMGATDPDQWWVHAPGGNCDWFIVDGPALADVVRRFTTLVGRVPMPRRWWLGFWTSALAFSSADEVEGVGRRLRKEGYPCDVLVIDGPWRGGPEFLQKYMTDGEYPTSDLNWHPDFGDGPSMVKANADMGFKTVIHQNSRSWLPATIRTGVACGALREEGRECVVRVGTPEGDAFYAEAVRPRHQDGIATWWLDHGDRVSGEVLPGVPSRNLFGAMWARLTAERMEADGVGRQLVLIRGAGIGGQRSALPWPGDTRFGIDAFIDDLWFCLSAGLCGFPVTSFDLGGFMPGTEADAPHNTAYDIDNLTRRLCQGILFAPSPRMHQCNTEPPKLPWNCPPEVQALYRAMLVERYRLTPYVFSYAVHAARTGEPIVRPLVYHFQDDPVAREIGDQCMLGEWILLAPVFEHGATRRRLYLPAGRWVSWWSAEAVEGGRWIEVDAPRFDKRGLPMFVRAGAIVPRMAAAACLEDEVPSTLTLDVFPAGRSEFVCHESESVSHAFLCIEDGGVRLTLPNRVAAARRYEVRVHLASGLRTASCDVESGESAELQVR